ncbi:sensor histidine kinase [Croceiramulus getboli]|nr:ATP-binding protein [Flavobacteriaceae bacterium YJPT1-3]
MIDLDILIKTVDDLAVGVGIFEVEDTTDIKSIRYVFMNQVILQEMRKSREEVHGKKIIEVAPEAYEHKGGLQVMEAYRKVAAEGGSIDLGLVEYSNHMVAGTYECSVHHIQDNYIYVSLRNVTELEKTKNELEEKNKQLSQFAYMVSHDLKEPLNSVAMLTDLLQHQYMEQLDEQAKEFMQSIAEATERMSDLITDLLEYSALNYELEKVPLHCNDLVEVIQKDLMVTIESKQAVIEVKSLPTVMGYPTQLRMVFQNLISNALKFSKPDESPVITVTAAEKEKDYIFAIADRGIGISKEDQERVFEVFQRLHRKSEFEGNGIGLAHCKKIVELHQGKIWLESEPGQGSTFYFTIPK